MLLRQERDHMIDAEGIIDQIGVSLQLGLCSDERNVALTPQKLLAELRVAELDRVDQDRGIGEHEFLDQLSAALTKLDRRQADGQLSG